MMSDARTPYLYIYDFGVGPESRAQLLGQAPSILWFTGLSGAGKSAIADRLEAALHACGRLTYILDGDSVRRGLCKDLGFDKEDRRENVRRVAEVAKLMADAGIVVLVCLISPFHSDRELARSIAKKHVFAEVYVHAPLAVAEARDPKGLYRLARRGAIQNFTGIDSPYEKPTSPDVFIDTCTMSIDEGANMVLEWLSRH
ncbi:nodulation protein, Adenylyl-sulfate kinase (APS kinase) (ATP adenosine-5'-phosphosulfate 3'-phosphotransferase) (plasmid) [Cupriavidus taiwanensis]|uniref:Adenylyl-sulfate kinase n=2 Tax=Cupriavidus taiwanensis TaxID=164546 RepID=A0A375EC14_9BURK|nr:nodulation protein, Adenylyl-sulfate kinase (APS kinase) (ATP adenosine-5'-phosphosulfate 3'-phosphotransferase) [Cupriavidus taiwanensis]SOZ72149.1 nodulation protein, Adenylyl-sulfate kinase (APS kinase) (ATP adenosine-5'-phosphosulfate 3'-phosphotransferase) [Cupriavidus taiwanensis]SOZ74448.1 nodulation protein, Adenylyl-sulfate kinase (APS kinase) (ATP adenosine-5'-phosphosulfate 3'-phosphotransferase) [Cupriavidus taiwanensis]SPA11369.1 nodulation protein, Adenylyl-sulfate kinase (APS k